MTNQTPATRHLTEEERQALGDGTLSGDHANDVREHLRDCPACAADVRALEATMIKIRTTSLAASPVDDMWPAIRSRIEQTKIVPLPATTSSAPNPRRLWVGASVLAAAIVVAVVVALPKVRDRAGTGATARTNAPSAVVPVADSIQSYEAEARILLNHLEIQRAVMRPEADVIIDRDLKVIDDAINELTIAIANDPKNTALRQLLAESYRQKIQLLKRAQNAG